MMGGANADTVAGPSHTDINQSAKLRPVFFALKPVEIVVQAGLLRISAVICGNQQSICMRITKPVPPEEVAILTTSRLLHHRQEHMIKLQPLCFVDRHDLNGDCLDGLMPIEHFKLPL